MTGSWSRECRRPSSRSGCGAQWDRIVRDFDPTPRRLSMPVAMAPIRIQRERLEVREDPAPAAPTKESR